LLKFVGGVDGLMVSTYVFCVTVNSSTLTWLFFPSHFYFQHDTLICYLLDELHAYKTDYSDALAPISCDADISLAGEHALTRPASTEELRMVHADVNGLCNDMRSLTSVVVQAACSTAIALQHLDSSHRFTNVSECASHTSTPPYTTPPVGGVPAPVEQLLSPRPAVSPMPTAALSTSSAPRGPRVPTTASSSHHSIQFAETPYSWSCDPPRSGRSFQWHLQPEEQILEGNR
jgi:hypothetical protein